MRRITWIKSTVVRELSLVSQSAKLILVCETRLLSVIGKRRYKCKSNEIPQRLFNYGGPAKVVGTQVE
jgi:hypothetical protein